MMMKLCFVPSLRFQVCLKFVLVDPIRHLDDSKLGLVFLLENWKKKVIMMEASAVYSFWENFDEMPEDDDD